MIMSGKIPETDDFLTLNREELELIGNIREQMLKGYGGEVTSDIVDISPTEITLLFDITLGTKHREDVLIINRETLKWEL